MPRLFSPLMWWPAIPAYTECMGCPHISSHSSTAFLMACTVFSILTTTPLRKPSDLAVPTPTMLRTSLQLESAATAQILVVPISRPTTIFWDLLCEDIHVPHPEVSG